MEAIKKLIYIILIILVISVLVKIGIAIKSVYDKAETVSEINLEISWDESDGTIYQNTNYNLYIPTGLNSTKTQSLILFLHGGSWSSGTKEDMDYFCKAFAKKGYITATMSYSLISSNNQVTMETMLDDIDKVISEILVDGFSKGYSITSMALSGYSAGAQLALLYSYSRNDTSEIPLKFVASMAGPTDFHEDSWTNQTTENIVYNLTHLTGITVTEENLSSGEVQTAMDEISPIYYVNENTIPTVMFYSDSDETVLPIHYEKLVNVLEKNNVDYELIKSENASHVVFSDVETLQDFVDKVVEYAENYF